MRKKIYFIIYSVLQMIMGIVNFVNYQEYADALYKSVQDALSVMPEAAGMFTIESAISMSLFSAGICTSFAIIFLVIDQAIKFYLSSKMVVNQSNILIKNF